jgi:hypothetical protein
MSRVFFKKSEFYGNDAFESLNIKEIQIDISDFYQETVLR